MFRTALTCLAFASSAAAQSTPEDKLAVACAGWQADRLMLATVAQKNGEMIVALDNISTGNPGKKLASAMSDNLNTINGVIDKGRNATATVMETVCRAD